MSKTPAALVELLAAIVADEMDAAIN